MIIIILLESFPKNEVSLKTKNFWNFLKELNFCPKTTALVIPKKTESIQLSF